MKLENFKEIFCRFITLKNGKKLDAHDYGKKAWRFTVKEQKAKE